MDLASRIENYFDNAKFITFDTTPNDCQISIMFHNEGKEIFQSNKSYDDLHEYFDGRRMKLIISMPEDKEWTISLVDPDNMDTINLKNIKFIHGNIDSFWEDNVPNDTIFGVLFLYKNEKEPIVLMPEHYVNLGQIKIHGYSAIGRYYK